ncbi:MAG: hypothetical protein H8E85_03025 [Candidatus Marinimicrobia bacterium]|nr:hypothetical protein [Candidatus Neomarinimicrobiota bacterium]
MSQNQFYKFLIFIFLINYIFPSQILPINDEIKIRLNIGKRERVYHEIPEGGLLFQGIGHNIISGDSLKVEDMVKIGIYSRTVKSPTGNTKRNFSFFIQWDEKTPLELKYKEKGSKVKSPDRPGWIYTNSGKWFIYLTAGEANRNFKIFSTKGSPVTYVRVTAGFIKAEGKKGDDYKTVNRQKRIDITILNKQDEMVSTYWYPLTGSNQQQYELNGPSKVRLYTRVMGNSENNYKYFITIKEDGIEKGTNYFDSELSPTSIIANKKDSVSKWRSVWLNVPNGKHYYTFTLPDIEDNHEKTVYIRLKEWREE